MADEIRQGNRNPRNLYRDPTAAGHFAVVVGDLEHAAAMSAWLADAARAHLAAGHPMPEPTDLRAERDLALWLHAEAAWQRDILAIDFNSSEEDLTDARREIKEVRGYLVKGWYGGERGGDPADGTLSLLIGVTNQLTRERDALQARNDAAIARLKEADDLSTDWPPSLEDWTAFNSKLIHARAALQGDQPARTSQVDEVLGVCKDAIERGWTVEQLAVRVRAVYDPDLAAELERRARAAEAAGFDEPDVTPPDPSGRITDNGPVQPFTDTDHQEPTDA